AALFYKIPPERILILFDDIALPIGKVRVRAKGSAGGHNGIKSIISLCGSDTFPRIKIGVGAPPHPDYSVVDWVLGTFTSSERDELISAIDRALSAIPTLMADGCERAASKIN
ncbi:MAG: aminoacyl-tRNA hydrolase, partial [Clostridia bacterium]